MSTNMNSIDVNYILDNQLQLFDYLFIKKVGIDGDKNYVYHVQDKFRENRFAKFILVSQPRRVKQLFTQLMIYGNCTDTKLVQPIYDFTVSKQRKIILVTMPVPPRTLYTVIKDTTVDLRARLWLGKNIVDALLYMHCRRKSIFGQIRPQSIVIHQDLNVFGKTGQKKINQNPEIKDLYARINSFSMLTETKTKPQNWKWNNTEAHYYDAPEVWVQIEAKDRRKNENKVQTQKLIQSKQTSLKLDQKTDIWSVGLVLIQLLSAMKISQLLESKSDVVPAKLLRDIYIRLKKQKLRNKTSSVEAQSIQEQKQNLMTMQQFYEKLLRYIENFPLKSVIEKMLAYKPDKRIKIQEVYSIFGRLQVVDKISKNFNNRFSLFKNKQLQKQKLLAFNKNEQSQDNFDDRKSMASVKSSRSGRSSRSHTSEIRKKKNSDFPTLLYARQQIAESNAMHFNSLYRTYFQDCKNRLIAEQNFTPPAKKIIMKKQDKAICLKMKGQTDQDIKSWDLQKIVAIKSQAVFDQKFYQNASKQNQLKNINNQVDSKNKKNNLLQSGFGANEQIKNEQQKKVAKNRDSLMGYGPTIKKIPHNSNSMRQHGYNDNLTNYHYLSLLLFNQQKNNSIALFRPQSVNITQGPEKSLQFILNLKYRNLTAIPQPMMNSLQKPNCLKSLSLAHNQIVSLRPLVMNKNICQNLAILDVSFNEITYIDTELWKLTNLQQCYLVSNKIKQISGFDNQDDIQQKNRLKRLRLKYLQNSKQTKDLGHNQNANQSSNIQVQQIQKIPEQIKNQRGQSNKKQNKQEIPQEQNQKKQIYQKMDIQEQKKQINIRQQKDQLSMNEQKKQINIRSQQQLQQIQKELPNLVQEQNNQKPIFQDKNGGQIGHNLQNQLSNKDQILELEQNQKQIDQQSLQIKQNAWIKEMIDNIQQTEEEPALEARISMKLRRLYLDNNRIKLIRNIFILPSLEILSVRYNPLLLNQANCRAFDRLKKVKVKVCF